MFRVLGLGFRVTSFVRCVRFLGVLYITASKSSEKRRARRSAFCWPQHTGQARSNIVRVAVAATSSVGAQANWATKHARHTIVARGVAGQSVAGLQLRHAWRQASASAPGRAVLAHGLRQCHRGDPLSRSGLASS